MHKIYTEQLLYLHTCVQNKILGPCDSQKWHSAITAFIFVAAVYNSLKNPVITQEPEYQPKNITVQLLSLPVALIVCDGVFRGYLHSAFHTSLIKVIQPWLILS